MKNKQDKGFTLVELLIVIVILGILATVTVFAVRGITARSQTNACDVEQRALETAVEAYYVDRGQTFPTNLAALAPDFLKKAPTVVWGYSEIDGSVTAPDSGKCSVATPSIPTGG